jgi:hypothetical protein
MKKLLLILLLLSTSVSLLAQTTFKVQLDWDNNGCTSGGYQCDGQIYRAVCSNMTCPVYNTQPTAFTKLSGTVIQTVTTSNTHFTFTDTGTSPNPSLPYAVWIAYAVTNSFQANPSSTSTSTQIQLQTPTGAHQAILNWSSTACTSSFPCTIQVYRATCSSSTSCPSYPGTAWTALNMSVGLASTPVAQNTTWQYTDNDSKLVGSTTFAWLATVSYQGASTSSPASTVWIGTTGVGKTIKVAPTKFVTIVGSAEEHVKSTVTPESYQVVPQ